MRKISIVVFGLILGIAAFTSNASAQESINTNIKTEFQLKNNVTIFQVLLTDTNQPGFLHKDNVPVESERDKTLSKWKSKQKSANLPKEQFTINASAYTAAADECGKSDGITASGLKVKEKETIERGV